LNEVGESIKLEALNLLVGFGARQAIPLQDLEPESLEPASLEPGSVGTWLAVSSTQRENLEYPDQSLKPDLIKSFFPR
jgi:hypothetical protein